MSHITTRRRGRGTQPWLRHILALPILAATAAAGVGLVGVSPAAALTTDLTTIKINEVESNGDPNGDWIELYNTSDIEAVDLSDGILSDGDNSHAFPLSGTIQPGGYLAFYVDQGTNGFGLGDPDQARLFQGNDTSGSLIDSYSWTNHAPTTYGRNPDGTGPFQVTDHATFEAANVFPSGGIGDIDGVVINEVESSGDAVNGDWIELYNKSSSPIDISGALLSDDDNGHVFEVPANTTLAAGDWAAFTVDSGASGFGLGASDKARLFAPGDIALSTVVDEYTWANHATVTWGRSPDGTGPFKGTATGTFGAANDFGAPSVPDITGVVINEVESTGDDTHGDWIELKNTNGSGSVDLSDAILSDDSASHVFRIPDGTSLAAGAVKAFRVDNPAVNGNFGLGDNDGARLFAADAIDLGTIDVPGDDAAVDTQSWTEHAPVTYGLNGSGVWAETRQGTFDGANDFTSAFTYDISWVVLSEIESSGGTPGDWIELHNTAPVPVDISGAQLADDDDTHVYTIPADTTIPAGGFYTVDIDTVTGGFGLGATDAVRFYRAGKVVGTDISLDHHEWEAHADVTYIRTADGFGDWAESATATKNAANPS